MKDYLYQAPEPMRDFLTYMEDTTLSNAVDEELLQLQEIINNVKNKQKLRLWNNSIYLQSRQMNT